nr:DUF202 domain-containing protein [Pseudomonas sp. TH34]
MQAERTALAWRRTQLAFFLVAAHALRCLSQHTVLTLLISLSAGGLALLIALGQRRRYASSVIALTSAQRLASPGRIVLLSIFVSLITLATLIAVLSP